MKNNTSTVKRFKCQSPDIVMQVLTLLKIKMVPGCEVTDTDWNLAYSVVHAQNSIDTIQMLLDIKQGFFDIKGKQ